MKYNKKSPEFEVITIGKPTLTKAGAISFMLQHYKEILQFVMEQEEVKNNSLALEENNQSDKSN